MSTCSVSQSNVDIDTYFDMLDFDVSDLDVTATLIKTSSSESRFQLPVPVCQSTHSEIKPPLGQLALKQAAYEVSLLARQLETAPFNLIEPFEDRYPVQPSRHSKSGKPGAIARHCVIALGLIVSTLPVYAHYSRCSTTMSCLHQAKSQLVGMLSDRPQATQMLSNAVSSPQATIAPTPASTPAPTTGTAADPFREAVNQAMRAAELTQTATQAAEWETVVNSWLEAIRLMNLTPPTNPRYNTAALKVEEYAKNLAYAQRRMREAIRVAETQDTASPTRAN